MIVDKKCCRCGEKLPSTREYFYINKRNRDGLTYSCIPCQKKKVKKYRKDNHERLKEEKKEYHLMRTYGLSVEDYNRIFDEQNGRCKICGRHQTNFKNALHVDHNHKNMVIRGLLCYRCNHILGSFKENPLIFIKMAKYVVNDGDCR